MNANLEAKFIKDTIINSLNEDEFTIDIENYSKSHLRDFETQINDIKIWFNKNKNGQIVVRNQADKVIDKYRILNFLKREKKELVHDLANRMGFIEQEKSILISNYTNENDSLRSFFKNKENLKDLHLKREQKVISEIDYNKKELDKANKKQTEYDNQNIAELILNVSKKNALENEQKNISDEKNILNSAFGAISQKYDSLIAQVQNQNQEFTNNQNATINNLTSSVTEAKTLVFETYNKLINQIKDDNKEEKENAFTEINIIVEEENRLKRNKAELKHQTFFTTEIEKYKDDKKAVEKNLIESNTVIKDAKNKIETTRKEWDLESKEIERVSETTIEKEKEKQQIFHTKIKSIENKIAQSKSSLYGWLNDTVPNWENTIGKVIDEENVLFNTELNPKLIEPNVTTLFGIALNLNTLTNRIKTVKEYNQEIEELNLKITAIQNVILKLNSEKDASQQKLKTKFKKQLNELKEVIAQNEYTLSQNEDKQKKII